MKENDDLNEKVASGEKAASEGKPVKKRMPRGPRGAYVSKRVRERDPHYVSPEKRDRFFMGLDALNAVYISAVDKTACDVHTTSKSATKQTDASGLNAGRTTAQNDPRAKQMRKAELFGLISNGAFEEERDFLLSIFRSVVPKDKVERLRWFDENGIASVMIPDTTMIGEFDAQWTLKVVKKFLEGNFLDGVASGETVNQCLANAYVQIAQQVYGDVVFADLSALERKNPALKKCIEQQLEVSYAKLDGTEFFVKKDVALQNPNIFAGLVASENLGGAGALQQSSETALATSATDSVMNSATNPTTAVSAENPKPENAAPASDAFQRMLLTNYCTAVRKYVTNMHLFLDKKTTFEQYCKFCDEIGFVLKSLESRLDARTKSDYVFKDAKKIAQTLGTEQELEFQTYGEKNYSTRILEVLDKLQNMKPLSQDDESVLRDFDQRVLCLGEDLKMRDENGQPYLANFFARMPLQLNDFYRMCKEYTHKSGVSEEVKSACNFAVSEIIKLYGRDAVIRAVGAYHPDVLVLYKGLVRRKSDGTVICDFSTSEKFEEFVQKVKAYERENNLPALPTCRKYVAEALSCGRIPVKLSPAEPKNKKSNTKTK